ncbi:toxin glutamine deamidase domain-containing protein [Streptomyces catenulae]|uniref:Pre-toxin TG domain-containing protein n=1 Tax=Streptomyces catenulae TaxID=66875 RepID=A0ABV2YTX5_9ACTN|nr:pre-toxin TG domain-containing protein [Streptomyces catenulae]
MNHRWKTRAAAFLLALSVLFTGAMGQAAAAEPKPTRSVLEKCEGLPLREKLSCLKDQVKGDLSRKAGLLEIYLLVLAEHEWHTESKKAFPELYEKSQQLKKLTASLVKVKAEDFEDPEVGALLVATQQQSVKSLQITFEAFTDIAYTSAQLVKAMSDLMVLMAPVVKGAADIVTDPEVNAALGQINSGFDRMDHALDGLNADVGRMNKAVNQMNVALDQANSAVAEMNRGLDQMNQGVDRMNAGLGRMNKAIDQANAAMDQINHALSGANDGVGQANEGVTGMGKALDGLHKALKGVGGGVFKDLDLSGVGDYVRGGPKAQDDKVRQAVVSAVANLIPGVGDAKGVMEALTGKDTVTGDALSPADRVLGAVILLRWVKAGKTGVKVEELLKAVKNEKSFNRIGNVRWGRGGGGTTVLGDSYKTPVTDDLRELVNPGGGKANCRACVLGVERALDGAPAAALPELGRGSLASVEKYFPGKRFVNRSLSNIVKDIKGAGDGARGIVYGADPDGGHVFNVINRGGDVVFLDAQSGHAAPAGYSNYQFMRTK